MVLEEPTAESNQGGKSRSHVLAQHDTERPDGSDLRELAEDAGGQPFKSNLEATTEDSTPGSPASSNPAPSSPVPSSSASSRPAVEELPTPLEPTQTSVSPEAPARHLSRFQRKRKRPIRAISTIGSTEQHDLVKLEVITAKEMIAVRVIQALASIYNFLFLAIVTGFARGKWLSDPECTEFSCPRADFRAMVWFNFLVISIMCTINFGYLIYFLYLLRFRTNSRRPEPYWALMFLLPAVVIANNPLIYFDRIQVFSKPSAGVSEVLSVLRYCSIAFTLCFPLLYIILKFGSLGRSANLDDPYGIKFYAYRLVPTIALFIPCLTTSLALKIEISPQPFVSFLSFAQSGLDFSKRQVTAVATLGALQLLFIMGFLIQYYRTSRKIVQVSYQQARLKVLNLFFFFWHTCVPVILAVVFTSLATATFSQAATRIGSQIRPDSSTEQTTILDVPYYARSGIVVVYSIYAIIESFVSLPSKYHPTWLERLLIDRFGLHVGGALAPESGSEDIDEKRAVEDMNGSEVAKFAAADAECEHSLSSLSGRNTNLPILWYGGSRQQAHGHRLRMDETVLLFNISWLVYLSDEVIEAALGDNSRVSLKLRKIWRESTRDLVMLTLVSEDKLIVSFRGTVSAANWKINVLTAQKGHYPLVDPAWLRGKWRPPAYGSKRPRVHKGFYSAYESLRAEILKDIKSCWEERPSRRVLLTGHSLGGALATYCAFDCRVELGIPDERVSLVTFGSPKIGNRAFTRRFAVTVSDSFRFVNHSDLVTNIPTSVVHIYEHVPRGVLVDSSGNLIVDPMYADLKIFHGNQVTPHMMQAYKKSVQAFIDDSARGKYSPDWWDFSKYDAEAVQQSGEDMLQAGEALVRQNTPLFDIAGNAEESRSVKLPAVQSDNGVPPSPAATSPEAALDRRRERSRLMKLGSVGSGLLHPYPFDNLEGGSQSLLGTPAGHVRPDPEIPSESSSSESRDRLPNRASVRIHSSTV